MSEQANVLTVKLYVPIETFGNLQVDCFQRDERELDTLATGEPLFYLGENYKVIGASRIENVYHIVIYARLAHRPGISDDAPILKGHPLGEPGETSTTVDKDLDISDGPRHELLMSEKQLMQRHRSLMDAFRCRNLLHDIGLAANSGGVVEFTALVRHAEAWNAPNGEKHAFGLKVGDPESEDVDENATAVLNALCKHLELSRRRFMADAGVPDTQPVPEASPPPIESMT